MYQQFHINNVALWGKDLVNKYPLIFTELDTDNLYWHKQTKNPSETYVNLRYGFECGEGWKELIERIAHIGTQLVEHLRVHGFANEQAYIHACIVKEKFGGLRWQGNATLPLTFFSELWLAYVARIQDESFTVCEETGKFGLLRQTKNKKKGCWIRTLCTEKALENGYDLEDWEIEKLAKEKIKLS